MLSEALRCPCHHISKISRAIALLLKILSTWLASLVVIVLCPYEVHRGFKSTSPLSKLDIVHTYNNCHSVVSHNFEKKGLKTSPGWLERSPLIGLKFRICVPEGPTVTCLYYIVNGICIHSGCAVFLLFLTFLFVLLSLYLYLFKNVFAVLCISILLKLVFVLPCISIPLTFVFVLLFWEKALLGLECLLGPEGPPVTCLHLDYELVYSVRLFDF